MLGTRVIVGSGLKNEQNKNSKLGTDAFILDDDLELHHPFYLLLEQ
jgi:hypothetical protein